MAPQPAPRPETSTTYGELLEAHNDLSNRIRVHKLRPRFWRSDLMNLELALCLAADDEPNTLHWWNQASSRPAWMWHSEEPGRINPTLLEACKARVNALREARAMAWVPGVGFVEGGACA